MCNNSVLDTNFSHRSPKKAKKPHFQIQILVPQKTKMLRNPILGHFEIPKEYGRHCHFVIDIWEKSIFWGSFGSK